MKKQNYVFILSFFLFLNSASYGQMLNLEWAKNIGGAFTVQTNSIAIDDSANVYATGWFVGMVDFDPGPGTSNLTSSNKDIFVLKLDALGNLVWAKSMGTTTDEEGTSIVVDTLGNVYIGGWFRGTVDFDPNSGTVDLISVGFDDGFIQKLDALGNLVWVKQIGGISSDKLHSMAIDSAGNIYTIGNFGDIVDFDPGPGVSNLPTIGAHDIFVQKLDINGNLIWAKSVGGPGGDNGFGITVDQASNVYTTGFFSDTVDFDPNLGISMLSSTGSGSIFVQKLDINGNLVWAKSMGGAAYEYGKSIAVDNSGNVYTAGSFQLIGDFDPNIGISNLSAFGNGDIFIQKLDVNGNLAWAKSIGNVGYDEIGAIKVDEFENVYAIGKFEGSVNFDLSGGVNNIIAKGGRDIFIQKLDVNGNSVWVETFGGFADDIGTSIVIDRNKNIYATGVFKGGVDFDPSVGINTLTSIGTYADVFVQKITQTGVTGRIYHDFNQDCVQDVSEIGLSGRMLVINPGNIIVTTDDKGTWFLDSLPIGNYTAKVDTSSNSWLPTCSTVQSFVVVNSNQITEAPYFGFISTDSCAQADVSMHAPFLRPGFSNQKVYVQVCNQGSSTGALNNAYVVVELDSLLSIQSSSLPYQNLGNNLYEVNLGNLIPGVCSTIVFSCSLSVNAILGQSICMNASLHPIDSCNLDTIPNHPPFGMNPCWTPYGGSNLVIRPNCINDSISFVITNTGDGDMTCYSQVRLYIDGRYIWMDSIRLVSRDTALFVFPGDGRTWRMEVDQHSLHPGNSQPSSTIELCGSSSNWTPNLVTVLPQNDADPIIDVFCGLVTGSYDPNDKTGYPLGLGSTHDILPNQDLEYLIRFQNTGTDTAFTVVIRDTLSTDLDIFSIQLGTSSHNYSYRLYGPRILEWTFNNIMLPDSNINEPNSHGFIKFKVNQASNLPLGTIIENNASIYFDFNLPIYTNTTQHRIALPKTLNWQGEESIDTFACDSVVYRSIVYKNSGAYWQTVSRNGGDSLFTLNISILNSASNLLEYTCSTYTAPNGQIYTTSGQYTAVVPNIMGCDSLITIDLIIVPTDTTITQIGTVLLSSASNASFQWLNCDSLFTPILGAVTESFSPLMDGNYALEISQNGCIDTSSCYPVIVSNISNLQKEVDWLIYPNPVRETLSIRKKDKNSNEIFVKLINNLGQVLITKKSTKLDMELNLSTIVSGVYYVSINNGKQTIIQKIVKK